MGKVIGRCWRGVGSLSLSKVAISSGRRMRPKGPRPVAQKGQRIGQPTWEEMQRLVRRG